MTELLIQKNSLKLAFLLSANKTCFHQPWLLGQVSKTSSRCVVLADSSRRSVNCLGSRGSRQDFCSVKRRKCVPCSVQQSARTTQRPSVSSDPSRGQIERPQSRPEKLPELPRDQRAFAVFSGVLWFCPGYDLFCLILSLFIGT